MDPTKLLDDEPGEMPAEFLEATEEISAPTNAEIAQLAYEYWEARGRNGGSPLEDWFRAEEELKRKREI
jgi:hypothetical protein